MLPSPPPLVALAWDIFGRSLMVAANKFFFLLSMRKACRWTYDARFPVILNLFCLSDPS